MWVMVTKNIPIEVAFIYIPKNQREEPHSQLTEGLVFFSVRQQSVH